MKILVIGAGPTGATPPRGIQRSRLRRAQHLLETTEHPVERIAIQVGLGSPTNFRDHLKRLAGTSPHTGVRLEVQRHADRAIRRLGRRLPAEDGALNRRIR